MSFVGESLVRRLRRHAATVTSNCTPAEHSIVDTAIWAYIQCLGLPPGVVVHLNKLRSEQFARELQEAETFQAGFTPNASYLFMILLFLARLNSERIASVGKISLQVVLTLL